VNTVEVRGVTLSFQSGGAVTATDSSMLSNATGRSVSNIAWSPDGKRFAWIENGAILTAVPGGRPAVLYPTKTGDPKPLDSSDTLAWGPDCCGGGDSVLAFLSELPSFAVQALTIKGSVVDHRAVLFRLKTHCDSPNVCTMSTGSAFAFSPKGQLLAFFGLSDDLLPGVWAIPMGVTPHTPSPVLFASDIGGTDRINSVMSMDWSPSGARLALSVITGTDPNYPWRDLKIVDLTYGYDGVAETVSSGAVRPNTNPGSSFGAASSEHSPQWDPKPGDACQRLAFSQSSDSGRKLYLVDLVDGNGCNTALRPMSAKNPRALDWRVK
jgi:WD40 repeat protein